MKIIRKQVIERIDADAQTQGTPAAKAPERELGIELIAKERYTSVEFMQREWARVWTKVWLLGCREDQIPDAGDFICTNIGGESVLLVRQVNGGIRAFYNVCMHRGNRLASEGVGHNEVFQCSYHNWQYSLDGRFLDIPDLASFPQGAPPCSGLREIPCDTWASFVWFSLNEDVEPLRDYMGEVAGHMEHYHFERMAMTRWVTAVWNCNWKTSVDAFSESYHTAKTHPQLLWYLDDYNVQIDLYDKHSRYLIPFGVLSPRVESAPEIPPPLKVLLKNAGIDPAGYEGSIGDIRRAVQQHMREHQAELGKDYSDLNDDQLTDDYNYLVFPNITFNTHADDLMLFRSRPHPTDPNKMLFDIWMFELLPEGAERPELPRHDFREEGCPRSLGMVIDQDAANLASVQEGMNSVAYPGLWLSEQELRIRHFHQTLSEMVGG
ncbi:MAG: aromatic ring-hydroxylating dioxygenase subunit alpha [Gammaproteobacteria bacterium]|nr:aromatic ring-hydroxylating dioxygenase subunit alpha [Gammaproteobacteria bacterium]